MDGVLGSWTFRFENPIPFCNQRNHWGNEPLPGARIGFVITWSQDWLSKATVSWTAFGILALRLQFKLT